MRLAGLLLSQLVGCMSVEHAEIPLECPSGPETLPMTIKTGNDVFPVVTDSVAETVASDVLTLNDYSPETVCGLNELQLNVVELSEKQEEELRQTGNGVVLGGEYSVDDRLDVYNWSSAYLDAEAMLDGTRDSFLHEFGHRVNRYRIYADEFEEFAAFSWNKEDGCTADDALEKARECFTLAIDDAAENFPGSSSKSLVYGAYGAEEDWAEVYRVASASLLNEEYPGADFPTEDPADYSATGLAKFDWMLRWIASHR